MADPRIDDMYINQYRCGRCVTEWENLDDCMCDDRCPECNQSTSPHTSQKVVESEFDVDSDAS